MKLAPIIAAKLTHGGTVVRVYTGLLTGCAEPLEGRTPWAAWVAYVAREYGLSAEEAARTCAETEGAGLVLALGAVDQVAPTLRPEAL